MERSPHKDHLIIVRLNGAGGWRIDRNRLQCRNQGKCREKGESRDSHGKGTPRCAWGRRCRCYACMGCSVALTVYVWFMRVVACFNSANLSRNVVPRGRGGCRCPSRTSCACSGSPGRSSCRVRRGCGHGMDQLSDGVKVSLAPRGPQARPRYQLAAARRGVDPPRVCQIRGPTTWSQDRNVE